MKNIVLDTNTLMAVSQFGIDIFEAIGSQMQGRYHLFVLDKTANELEKLINEARLSEQKAAKLALQLIKHKNVKTLKTPKNKLTADDELLKLKGYAVLTQDRELKKKLKGKGIEVYTIRQKRKIIKA